MWQRNFCMAIKIESVCNNKKKKINIGFLCPVIIKQIMVPPKMMSGSMQ